MTLAGGLPMKKMMLSLFVLLLVASTVWAQVPDAGWELIVVREASDGTSGAPTLLPGVAAGDIEVVTFAAGQKAALGTNLINGATISQISTLHVDRLDVVLDSGAPYAPYFNIWVTDGMGNYAVLANEPSDGEWAGSRWDVTDWNFLKTKRCKVYETVGASGGNPGTSWVFTHTGIAANLVFEDVADLIISPPPPAYIAAGNGVGSGAPDELVTNVAYGYNWVFGDTQANYVSGDPGVMVNNYSAVAIFAVQNVTQGTSYATIEAAIAAAVDFDVITIDDGTYNPPSTLAVNKALTITGASEAGVIINIPAAGGYGISVGSGDVTLENFTLATNVTNQNYPIHASGATELPSGFTNLTLRNITIQGTHRRTGFDVHGFNTVIMSNLTSSDATGGNGAQITGCVGVTIDNITTTNNAWGSFAIYASNSSYLNRGSSNVVIDGASCVFSEGNLFSQDEFGLFNTNITVNGYGYMVRNFNYRAGAEGYTHFQATEPAAIAFAAALDGIVPGSFITLLSGGTHIVAPGMGIQFAIDGAAAGDAINVAVGHFEEQLYITKNDLVITGAGAGMTYVDSPPTLTLFYATSQNNYPIVFVDGCTGLDMSGFTVDGLGRGNANYRFQGVGFWNAGGALSDMHVANITDTPFSGAQHCVGVYAYNVTGGPYAIAMTDVLVDGYQKGGVALSGMGLDVDLTRVTTVGAGSTTVTAQNGLQVSYGATGDITDCVVSANHFSPATWWASGVLLYENGLVTISGTNVDSSQGSISINNGNAAVVGGIHTNVTGAAVGAYSWAAKSGTSHASPITENYSNPSKAATVVTVDGVSMDGNNVAGVWGVDVWTDEQLDFTLTNSTIVNFDEGLHLDETVGTITGSASGNTIADNALFGGFSTTAVPFNAQGNWWGSASGPLHATLNPAGLGNTVSDNILFEPWSGMAAGSIIPVATGPVNCSQTITLTFNFTADAFTPDMFLYNAVVSADAGLDFGAIVDLEPFTDVDNNFFAMSTGMNQWTITGSTVGNPSSPVTGAGTTGLFTITFSATGDVIGNVSFDSLVLRDPNNAPIPVVLSAASIVYDCTAPAAVTAITAAPGHNKVDVAWVHSGADVDHYEIFSGVWHDGSNVSVYPEYDDVVGNIIPTAPSSPTVANGSAEWDALTDVSAPALGLTQTWIDQASRGVYYYTVFAVDVAGNVSAAPAALDRATNYWLGDVAGTNGTVAVIDITALGSSFGTIHGGVGYNNFTDVGPTDDWSRVGIPTTDNVINFEDLMVFSMNFGVVSNAKTETPISKKINLAWVSYDDGSVALRLVEGSGLKGLRVRSNQVVADVTAGQLLDDQSELTFLKNVGQKLDVNVAVMGINNGFEGSGDLFVLRANSDIKVDDLTITLRGIDNSKLEFTMDKTNGTLTPRVFSLAPNYPNPFNPMTKISFSLPEAQSVKLAVYSIDGRRVATLINETRGPGLHEIVWTGQNDAGQSVSSGLYFYRIDAGPYSQVRKMTLMK